MSGSILLIEEYDALVAAIGSAIVLSVPSSMAEVTDPVDPTTAEARRLYAEGIALSKSMQWSDALAAFEKSRLLRPHPATTFNIGYCQRALGRFGQ